MLVDRDRASKEERGSVMWCKLDKYSKNDLFWFIYKLLRSSDPLDVKEDSNVVIMGTQKLFQVTSFSTNDAILVFRESSSKFLASLLVVVTASGR